MNKFVSQPLEKKMNRQNPMTRIERLENKTGPQPSAVIGNVSELSPDAGDFIAGTYYVVDQQTGAIRGYMTATPNDQFPGYHLAFFDNAGVLQFGVSADTGQAIAGGGVVTLDDDGISIDVPASLTNGNSYKFASGGTVLGGMYAYEDDHFILQIQCTDEANTENEIYMQSRAQTYGRIHLYAEELTTHAISQLILVNGAINLEGVVSINVSGFDRDLTYSGTSDAKLLHGDAGLNAIGIGGDASSDYKVKTYGSLLATDYIYHDGTYAGIYVADASATQAIPTGTTYTKCTLFTTNGLSSNCTADSTNDKITITHPGKYFVTGSFSVKSGTNNVELKGALFLDGVEQSNVHWERKIGTAGDVGSASFCGFISSAANKDVDFRLRHDNAGSVNVTVTYANLTAVYVGE